MALKTIPPPGYDTMSSPRLDGRSGGGIALVFKQDLKIKHKACHAFISCECSEFTFNTPQHKLTSCTVYRPPDGGTLDFIEDLASYYEKEIGDRSDHIFIGDFNIQMNHLTEANTINFNDFMEMFNLSNWVLFPTYPSGNTLDLFIPDTGTSILETLKCGDLLSDHCFVDVTLKFPHRAQQRPQLSARMFKNVDLSLLCRDLSEAYNMIEASSVDALAKECNEVATLVIDTHDPFRKSKMKTTSHNQPWHCDLLHKEVQLCRRKEKFFLHDPAEYNYYVFYLQCKHVANLSRRLERDFYQKVFKNC